MGKTSDDRLDYQRNYYQKNKEKLSQRAKDRYYANRGEILSKEKDRREDPVFREKRNAQAREHRKNNRLHYSIMQAASDFGISYEEASELRSRKCCEICGSESSRKGDNLAIDHCHSTGKVRGVLCTRCNNAIGNFSDNIALLERAINYLKGA